MSDLIIRPAEERDLEQVLDIVNREIEVGFAHFGLETMTLRRLVSEWRDSHRAYPWFVAERGGEIVGYCRASHWKPRGAYQWTTEIGVYVKDGCQGQGVGRRLYAALFPALELAGFCTVVAGIALPNEASVRLHESFGMKKVAHLPAMGFKLGAWRDVGYWSLRLRPSDFEPTSRER